MKPGSAILAVFAVASMFVLMGVASAWAQSTPFVVRPVSTYGATEIQVNVGDANYRIVNVGFRQFDLVTSAENARFDIRATERTSITPHIAGLRPVPDENGARLRFILACDCIFQASERDGDLVLRITEPDRPAGAAQFSAASVDAFPTAADSNAQPELAGPRAAAPSRAPLPYPRHGAPPASTRTVFAQTPHSPGLDEEVLLARRHLMRQLSRAAHQGLVEFAEGAALETLPDVGDPDTRPPALAALTEGGGDEAVALAEAPSETSEAQRIAPGTAPPRAPVEIPVRAHSARDRDFAEGRSETIVRVAPCLRDDALDLRSWGADAPFGESIAAQRGQLLDQFDEPNATAVRALARLYVANGFGAEATRLIAVYGDKLSDGPLLADLGRIVDGRAPSPDGPIAATAPCSGAALLWRRAGVLPRAADPAANSADMLMAFSRLPPKLRALVAPNIIGQLVDFGETEQAQGLDLILSRAPVDALPSLDFARARLLAATGRVEAAEALYQRLARRGGAETQEALIGLLDSLMRRDAPVPSELTDALAVAARLARGGAGEADLMVAEARARERSEGMAAALADLSAALRRLPGEAPLLRDAVHAVIEQARAARESAATYAETSMRYNSLMSQGADGDTARWRMARELTEIGLPNAALKVLEPALSRGAAPTRRIAAEALVDLRRPDEALIQLEGLSGDEAERTRARAQEQLGKFDDALQSIAQVENTSAEQARLALKAGLWRRAESIENTPVRLLTTYMAEQRAYASQAIAPRQDETNEFFGPARLSGRVNLKDARAMLKSSQVIRSVVKEALEDG